MRDMTAIQYMISDWAAKTFQRPSTSAALPGAARHLLEEACEVWLAVNPDSGLTELHRELMDVVTRMAHNWYAHEGTQSDVAEELADVTIIAFHMASCAGALLEESVVDKMNVNRQRRWQAVDDFLRHIPDDAELVP